MHRQSCPIGLTHAMALADLAVGAGLAGWGEDGAFVPSPALSERLPGGLLALPDDARAVAVAAFIATS